MAVRSFLCSFWIRTFSGTLVKHSIACMRQESEIKRQQEGGCKHRGNWIMPLVGGNELSFFSISFTICFYLVINESSVWWQQAAGCLLAAAFSSCTACQTSLCFLYTHMHMQPAMQTQQMHTATYSYSRMYTFLRHAESRTQRLKHVFHTLLFFTLSGTLRPLPWWFYCPLKIFSWLYLIIPE